MVSHLVTNIRCPVTEVDVCPDGQSGIEGTLKNVHILCKVPNRRHGSEKVSTVQKEHWGGVTGIGGH